MQQLFMFKNQFLETPIKVVISGKILTLKVNGKKLKVYVVSDCRLQIANCRLAVFLL